MKFEATFHWTQFLVGFSTSESFGMRFWAVHLGPVCLLWSKGGLDFEKGKK